MRPVIIIIPLMTLAACAATKPTPDEAFAQQVEADVRRSLKDPDSAKFEDVKAYAKEQVACGKVNAKNSYGGYAGSEDFSYYQGRSHLQSDDLKSYVIGSGRCMLVESQRGLEDARKGGLPPKEKEKIIKMFEKNIADIKRDPTFGL
jgi:hypothetical protein